MRNVDGEIAVRRATSPIERRAVSKFGIAILHSGVGHVGCRVPEGDVQHTVGAGPRRDMEVRMSSIEQSIAVDVPVRAAYDQWTQFETFPSFMEGVEAVQQRDDTHLHWVANIAGVRREWDAEITEQRPDERIAWHALDGTENAGVVTFHRLDENRTKVMLQLDVEPEGIVEQAGDKLGFVRRQVSGDLERFKEFIEGRQHETGAWRGTVDRSDV